MTKPLFLIVFQVAVLAASMSAQSNGGLATISNDPPVRMAARLLSPVSETSEKQTARNSISALLEKHADSEEADFRANKGQWNSPARFRMDAPQMRVQFLEHGIEFGQTLGDLPEMQVGYLWSWTFINGNRDAEIIPDKTKGGSNFITSSNHSAFVPRNGEIWYDQIYYNIDIRFYGVSKTEFLYDFILYPYANLEDIKIEINGCNRWFIDKDNQLILEFAKGSLTRHTPQAYQYVKGQKEKIDIAFARTDEGYLTYKVGKYDESLPLVIH